MCVYFDKYLFSKIKSILKKIFFCYCMPSFFVGLRSKAFSISFMPQNIFHTQSHTRHDNKQHKHKLTGWMLLGFQELFLKIFNCQRLHLLLISRHEIFTFLHFTVAAFLRLLVATEFYAKLILFFFVSVVLSMYALILSSCIHWKDKTHEDRWRTAHPTRR